MHKLAKRSDAERRRLIGEFIDDTFVGLDAHPQFVAMMRSAMPELPDDPAPERLVGRYADCFGTSDTADYRRQLLTRLEVGNDPRAQRYWQLLGIINGWPAGPDLTPVFDWFIRALRAHPAR